jgi:hypothetical protein
MSEQSRCEQAEPAILGGGPPDGDCRIRYIRAIRARQRYVPGRRALLNIEQRQHGPDQPTCRQARQSLDSIRADPRLLRLGEAEQEIDVATIAERRFYREDFSDNPPIAVRQSLGEIIAGTLW